MDPWPQSYTYLKNTLVKLFGAHLTERGASSDAIPGTILSANSELIVQSSTGPVAFTELQFEGKRRISIRDAVNGKLIHPGDQFSTHPKIA
jgi:methionyl-tRNA formyltransferase